MVNMELRALFVLIFSMSCAIGQKDMHYVPGRNVMVHLFEWKWNDIALECERFLGPNGYGGVQVSPVTENVVIEDRPWYERYQPISYKLITRSGNEKEFADMVRRCNAVGVRIYVDAVINHMCAKQPKQAVGTGGSKADPENFNFPDIPYNTSHFNKPVCGINDYGNAHEVRNCELVGLRDLNHAHPHVRDSIVELMNRLVDLGVAGFRVDAAKHMWPHDIKEIYSRIKTLNTKHGFKPNSKPLIAQEVIYLGPGEPISPAEYTSFGIVTEFRFSKDIGRVFRGDVELKHLRNWGTGWSFLPSQDAFVFVDNHDNQRGHGAGGDTILTYRDGKDYRQATAWALAHPYGGSNVRIMSSFEFSPSDVNQGPPHDSKFNILSPKINPNGSCGNGWVCEHRRPTTVKMVDFRNVAGNENISSFWDNDRNQIALSRGNKAFIAFNRQNNDFDKLLNTHLPAGTYCDIISGQSNGKLCTGLSVVVQADGNAQIKFRANSPDGVFAIHVGKLSKLS